jgi:LPXTG-motif cell wall-anchored protein
VGVALVVAVSPASASRPMSAQVVLPVLRSTPSDSRAQFFEGNVVLCGGVGFAGSDQLSAVGNNSANDANVAATAQLNAGPVQPGQGEEVNVTITNPAAVIDAVVVKGGNGYNVYANPVFLPPGLPAPQHYISPLNGGGEVPNLSHWFICYHLTTPPPVGSLTVRKTVIPPDGPPATPLPTSYTALVNCNDGNPAHQNVLVTFNVGGGRGAGPTLTGIPAGTVCTVVEQNSSSFPAGSAVTYSPSGADMAGVTIVANAGVTVTITNDFSGLAPQSGSLRLMKVVVPAPPSIALPAAYAAHVSCDDGTEADVALPGTGGDGSPLLTVTAGALCTLGEDTASLPPGWVVTYTVGTDAPTSTSPIFNVAGNETVSVTITNDPTAVSVATTTTSIEPDTGGSNIAPPLPDTLPSTGASTSAPVTVGLLLVAAGLVAIGYTTRRRSGADQTKAD